MANGNLQLAICIFSTPSRRTVSPCARGDGMAQHERAMSWPNRFSSGILALPGYPRWRAAPFRDAKATEKSRYAKSARFQAARL